jgi:hypothetical protein
MTPAQLPGLLIVDGVTVPHTIQAALASQHLHADVPMVLSGMAQEGDLQPNALQTPDYTNCPRQTYSEAIACLNQTVWEGQGFGPWLEQVYSNDTWPNQSRPDLYKCVQRYYREDIAQSALKAYTSINADTGVICGSKQLADIAAHQDSPVYLVVSTASPSTAMSQTLFYNIGFVVQYAFHAWDLFAISGMFSKDLIASGDCERSDLMFGDAVIDMLAGMAHDGALERFGFAGSGGLWTNAIGPDGVVHADLGWRVGVCEDCWEANGVGHGYWWAD